MPHHRPLRRRGGAGGVHDDGEVVVADGGPGCGRTVAQQHPPVVEVGEARIERDDRLRLVELRRLDGRGIVAGADDEQVRPDRAEDAGQALLLEPGIERGDDPAETHHRPVGEIVLQAVGQERRDGRPFGAGQPREAGGQALDQHVGLRVGEPPVAVDHRGPVRREGDRLVPVVAHRPQRRLADRARARAEPIREEGFDRVRDEAVAVLVRVVPVRPGGASADDALLDVRVVRAVEAFGGGALQVAVGDRALVDAVLLGHAPVGLVQVVAEDAQHHAAGARRGDAGEDGLQVGGPGGGGAFVTPPVVGAERDEDEVGPLGQDVGFQTRQRLGKGLAPGAAVDKGVVRKAILQDVAVAAARPAAGGKAVPEADDLHAVRPSVRRRTTAPE